MKIAYSPCPNDTFVFHALVHGLDDASLEGFAKHLLPLHGELFLVHSETSGCCG